MFFARLSPIWRSLRFRLAIWNTAAVLLVSVGTLFVVRQALRFSLVADVDQTLGEDLVEVGLGLTQPTFNLDEFQGEMDRRARGHDQHLWFVQLVGGDGSIVWSSPNTPENNFPAIEARHPRRPTFATMGDERIAQREFDSPRMGRVLVRVGSSLRNIERAIAQATWTMTMATIGLLVSSPILGWWLAGRAVEPLAEIIDKTARMNPANLDKRLRVRGTGDELDRLSVTINGLLDRLATFVLRKRDLLADAAHELRSPLTAIKATVEVALASEQAPRDDTELLFEVQEQCASLGSLVNQLLLLATTDSGALERDESPVRLDRVVASCVEMFQAAAEVKRIALSGDHLSFAVISGSEGHVRQVINNLIDNAIKFTPEGGVVTVELGVDREAGQAILEVRDNGRGIPADDLPRVFDRFYQGDRSRGRADVRRGVGLGLAICQSIVQAYQGTIEVQSSAGSGATFIVRLPLRAQLAVTAHDE